MELPSMSKSMKILLYIPNIIGYIRFIILLYAWVKWSHPNVFLPLFVLSAGLDFVDGAVARHLNQTSAFGAWLDVVLDNISRSMIWTGLMPSYGFLISSVEWATFVCTHQLGRHWKKPSETQPKLVARIMANNFNTPLGHWIMFSLWFFPAWLYALQFYNMPFSLQSIIITTILAVGRTLAFTVEAWFIVQHVVALLGED